MGVAEFHHAGTFGVFHHAALERDGTQFVGRAAAGTHVFLQKQEIDLVNDLKNDLGLLLGGCAARGKAEQALRGLQGACQPCAGVTH
jgi:hypothetical protein